MQSNGGTQHTCHPDGKRGQSYDYGERGSVGREEGRGGRGGTASSFTHQGAVFVLLNHDDEIRVGREIRRD